MSQIIPLLNYEEGYREKPYIDTEGYPTVACGIKIGPKGAALSNYSFSVPREVGDVWLESFVNKTIGNIDARLAPLYSSPAIQAPMIDAESQWQERYTLTLSLQAHITVSFPQDYFDKAEITTEQVDDRP